MFINITGISKLCWSGFSYISDFRRGVNIVRILVSPETSHINISRMNESGQLFVLYDLLSVLNVTDGAVFSC